MKQWIRWWGLGLFSAIILAWYLCIDSLISYGIQTAGTKALGAKVEVASSELQLAPLSLSIKGLAISNPELPMQNLWYSDNIHLQLDSGYLLRRQIIIDDASITGIQFNTARTSSGSLKKSATKKSASKANNASTDPENILTDPKQLVANEQDNIKASTKKIENEIQALDDKWQKNIKTLPNKKSMAVYQQRWDELKKKNWLEKLNDTKALQKDIKKELDEISSLNKQLDKDKAKIKTLIDDAKKLPEQEADRILAKAGYSGGIRNLTQTLFGDEAKQWIQQLTGLFQTASTAKSTEPAAPERGKGQWIHFKENEPHPDLLIKSASLSGHFDLLGDKIDFTGQAQDLTHQAKRWPKPASFNLQGTSSQGASFNANGNIDLRKEPNSQLELSFKQLAVSDFVLSSSASMPITLKSSRLNGEGKMNLSGDKIKFISNSNFSNTIFNSENTNSTTQQLIANTLKSISSFDLQLGLSGNINNPDFSVKSNLEQALSKAFKEQASQKLNQYKENIRKELNAQMAPQLQGLTKDASFIDDIKKQLSDKQSEIKGFSKGLL